MQFPILQYLDVVIGLAVVMIVVATLVAAVTQFLLAALNARARYLHDGLEVLLKQIDPDKLEGHARSLAELVLHDDTVASKKLLQWNIWWQKLTSSSKEVSPAISPAKVIQREELVLLLLKLASQKNGPAATAKLRETFNAKDASGAAEMLLKIQRGILNQEVAHPNDAAAVWRTKAIQAVALKSDELHRFVAKVNAWYDNTMDRVIANFALEARAVTVVVAFFACAWLQLDTIAVVKRLSTDPTYRNAVVSQAERLDAVSREPSKQTPKKEEEAREAVAKRLAEVKDLNLLPAQTGFSVSPFEWPWPGLLISWVLVSLGAPFWYDLLKNAMGLRSVLAKKDDEDRKARREEQT